MNKGDGNAWRRHSSTGVLKKNRVTLSGPREGGPEAGMTKLIAANQKPLTLWCPNFATFSFYLCDMFWPHFIKIDQSEGLLLIFSHRDIPKIYKMKKFSSTWKWLKSHEGGEFWFRTGPHLESTNQKWPYNISILCKHINTTHALTQLAWILEASRRSTRVQSKSMIRSALFLAKH